MCVPMHLVDVAELKLTSLHTSDNQSLHKPSVSATTSTNKFDCLAVLIYVAIHNFHEVTLGTCTCERKTMVLLT